MPVTGMDPSFRTSTHSIVPYGPVALLNELRNELPDNTCVLIRGRPWPLSPCPRAPLMQPQLPGARAEREAGPRAPAQAGAELRPPAPVTSQAQNR